MMKESKEEHIELAEKEDNIYSKEKYFEVFFNNEKNKKDSLVSDVKLRIQIEKCNKEKTILNFKQRLIKIKENQLGDNPVSKDKIEQFITLQKKYLKEIKVMFTEDLNKSIIESEKDRKYTKEIKDFELSIIKNLHQTDKFKYLLEACENKEDKEKYKKNIKKLKNYLKNKDKYFPNNKDIHYLNENEYKAIMNAIKKQRTLTQIIREEYYENGIGSIYNLGTRGLTSIFSGTYNYLTGANKTEEQIKKEEQEKKEREKNHQRTLWEVFTGDYKEGFIKGTKKLGERIAKNAESIYPSIKK